MHHTHLSWLEAIVVGLFQGVSELFPVSSLGHSVLIPALIGGSWARDLDVSTPESPYLAFIVGLHVATAIALIAYFWRDWVRIVRGFVSSISQRKVDTPDQRLAWLLLAGTVPVGLIGLVFEHTFRTTFGKPLSASLFLALNGVLLLSGEAVKRRTAGAAAPREAALAGSGSTAAADMDPTDLAARLEDEQVGDRAVASDQRLGSVSVLNAVLIGGCQIGALFAGISRSGITMLGGLTRGLSHEDAARFSFLLATPVILAAGVLKVPDLLGHLGNGIRGQVLVGSIISGIGAYIAVRFLDRYFQTKTLTPFGIYCLVAGIACAIRFGFF